MPTIYLAVGGNIGDREANLRQGVALLAPAVRVTAASSLYESAPWGVTDQPPFLNAVLRGETELQPLALLDKCKAVEVALGRQPGWRWGPRPIDVDILLYDAQAVDLDRLTVPHARTAERGFVLRPLADLAPDCTPPGWAETVTEALRRVDTSDLRALAGPEWIDAG